MERYIEGDDMETLTVANVSYQRGLCEATEFIPRQLIDFACKYLKPPAKLKLFYKAAVAAQKAYNKIADRTPFHESYTSNDIAQLTIARKEAYFKVFATFLFNPGNYC